MLEDTEKEEGEMILLECDASIYVVAWSQEFAISLSIQPLEGQTWGEVTISLTLGDWTTEESFSSPWESNKFKEVTLTCNVVDSSSSSISAASIKVVNKGTPTESFDASYSKHFSCYIIDVKNPTRKFAVGYTDIRDADVLGVQIDNNSNQNMYVPIMFFMRGPANPTGLVPMIWVKDGDEYVPSGIPIQTSKNWHYKEMGNYLRAYTVIPIKPGLENDFECRVYYGFYGPLCSASHANLSLVGYNNNNLVGRWEQLAVGCFGETFCIDIEMCLTSQTVTDIRALMVCDKNKWGWTNAGWGADWLCAYNGVGRKLLLGGVKVGYLSQGPCLTEVKYVAYYGSSAEVHMDATVHTLRTNDYARTIQRIRYDFNTKVNFKDEHSSTSCGSCFYRVGGCAGWEGWYCKKVTLGNANGLLKNIEVPEKLQVGSFFLSRIKMTGPAPWWIAFPESDFKSNQKGLGIAWKCLIIRSFKSEIDGVIRLAPKVTLYTRQGHGDGTFYVDALISTNGDIFELNEGDNITFDVEFVTLPYTAESYYGDNTAFLRHLEECPTSWKTALREATENKIAARVDGGNVISTYPLIINITASMVKLELTGGVGALPVRFENLISKRYRLIDDLHPDVNIQWYETSFCPESKTYQMAFNLLLDDRDISSWTFLLQDSIS